MLVTIIDLLYFCSFIQECLDNLVLNYCLTGKNWGKYWRTWEVQVQSPLYKTAEPCSLLMYFSRYNLNWAKDEF